MTTATLQKSIREQYKEALPAILKQHGISNKFAGPRIDKISLNMGVGRAIANGEILNVGPGGKAVHGRRLRSLRHDRHLLGELRELLPRFRRGLPAKLFKVWRNWFVSIVVDGTVSDADVWVMIANPGVLSLIPEFDKLSLVTAKLPVAICDEEYRDVD